MSIKNLWPESFNISNAETPPIQILEEQAKLLPKLTNDMVYARVASDPKISTIRRKVGGQTFSFVYTFQIKGKFLDGFIFEVFSIGHEIDLYPLIMDLDEDIRKQIHLAHLHPDIQDKKTAGISVPNFLAFEELIGEILKSDKIYRVITSIMQLSVT